MDLLALRKIGNANDIGWVIVEETYLVAYRLYVMLDAIKKRFYGESRT